MNERNRRNQQARRQNQQSLVNHHNQQHQHQQSNNRSVYQNHHNAETYSSTNYHRHPSTTTTTTTTTTEPSSIAASQISYDDDCAVSIFYSYLIAIISSFLVVLGIYLAVTRFSTRFLYISLVGLSFEAIGACIYCISNIRASKLARRKQRLNSNDFILSRGGSNNEVIQDQNTTRQHQITTITHILSNRPLNSNVINDTNEVDTPAININNLNNGNLIRPIQSQQVASLELENNTFNPNDDNLPSCGEHLNERDMNSIVVVSNDNNQHQLNPITCTIDTDNIHQDSSANEQLPENQSCRLSPGNTSEDYLSSTCLLQQQQQRNLEDNLENSNNVTQVSEISVDEQDAGQVVASQSQYSINMISQFNSQLGDKNKNSAEPTAQQQNNKDEQETGSRVSTDVLGGQKELGRQQQQQVALTSPNLVDFISTNYGETNATTTSNDNNPPDLINLQPSSSGGGLIPSAPVEPQVVSKRTKPSQSQQKPANLRRTLVMGLSGEEEMIEIDEEDLDNMSILPPPYESISNNP